MRKTLFIVLLSLFSLTCLGQEGGPLKFLGIPIDGPETQFIAKLKTKGFVYSSVSEAYKGQFNGRTVDVYVHTNHDLVDRVYVAFPYTTESNIRIEFNRLLSQFKENSKYLELNMNEEIPAGEDISYEITVHDKRYGATFNYFDPDIDANTRGYALIDKFSGILPDNVLSEMKASIVDSYDQSEEAQLIQSEKIAAMVQEAMGDADEEKAFLLLSTLMDGLQSIADGEVWFMIHEAHGRYQIGLYYDNLHNKAHGEDL